MLPSPKLPPGAHTCFPARAPCPLANSLLPASLYLPNADNSFTLTVVTPLTPPQCHRSLQKRQKGQHSRELPPDMPKPRGSPPSEHGVGLCWPPNPAGRPPVALSCVKLCGEVWGPPGVLSTSAIFNLGHWIPSSGNGLAQTGI